MCNKLVYLISFVLALVLAGNVLAEDYSWGGGGADNLWSTSENWNPNGVPTDEDTAQINIADGNCLIDDTVTAAESIFLYVGENTGPCYLNMTGGSLTTSANMHIGYQGDSNGVFILSGGTVDLQGARLQIGYNSDANGTLIINGGEMTAGDKIELGKNGGGYGQIFINGGTLNVAGAGSDDFEIGKYGTGIVTMTGGVVDVTDNIKLGQNGGTGRLYLYGGTFNNGNDEPIIGTNPESFIDITEGTLVLSGDAVESVNALVGEGKIKAYNGTGRVNVSYDGEVTTVTASMAPPELAWNPNPGNFSTVLWTPAGPTLTWNAGEYAVSHDVYFGTDRDDVNDANNTPGLWPEFKGNQDPCSYEPGPLELGETYYWRIDEVNDNAWAPPGSPWKGSIWEFKVVDYVVVDDMDDYGDNTGLPWEPGDAIFYIWRDGWYTDVEPHGNDTGSQVYHWDGSGTGFMESTIVRSGNSMPFYYENDGDTDSKPTGGANPDNPLQYYSEAAASISDLPSSVDPNWTAGGVKALSLWFYGDPDNDANVTEQMYVALEDGDNPSHTAVVPYDGDMNDIKRAQWQEWNIDLAEFTNVNLTNVQKIYIGFGDRDAPASGGKGIVYFDDIRLYTPRCVPSRRQPAGDLDDDCDVDSDDLDVMTEDWLEGDYNAAGKDGVLNNFPNDNSQWVNDATRGRCLQFDGLDDWVDINDSDFSDFHDKTISLWVKIRAYPEPYPYVFCFQNAGDDPYRIYFRTRGEDVVRVRFVEDYLANFTVGTNVWHHLAFVLRDTGSGMCTGEFYGDGVLIDQLPNQPRHSGGAKGVNLGSFNDGASGFLNAVYDEFRVYNDALSADNIKYLAEVSGGVVPTTDMLLHYKFDEVSGKIAANSSTYVFNHPLLSDAELYAGEAEGSRKINFKDFAVLADTWLEDQVWP